MNNNNLIEDRNNIIKLWIKELPSLFESHDLKNDIRSIILDIIGHYGYNISLELNNQLEIIITEITKDISKLNNTIYNLKKYKNKKKIESIIKTLSLLQKKIIEQVTQKIINNYLDQIIKLFNENINIIHNMLGGSNNNIKYLDYEINYLIIKINLLRYIS